jgi:hypothetical protein
VNTVSTPPNAATWRALRRRAIGTQLEQMAATWDQLAEARARQLAKDGKTEEEDDGRPDEITSAGSDPRER